MTRRLRRDWFHRYVVNPPAFRPGTRMPTGWPDGKSMLPKVLGGDTARQVEAVWQYLSDGPDAAEPYGLGREPIPLVADERAGHLPQLHPGGRPAGHRRRLPREGEPRLRRQRPAARPDLARGLHRRLAALDRPGRGLPGADGRQRPRPSPPGPPFARLPSPTDRLADAGLARRWATSSAATGSARTGRPTFLYDVGAVHVEDFPEAVAGAEGRRRSADPRR